MLDGRIDAAGGGPVEQVLGGFGTRRAALDFAFFKMNLPEHAVALLVDFVVRRDRGIAQVRASLHAPSHGGVHWVEHPLSACQLAPGRGDAQVSIGRCTIGAGGSAGTVGPVSWELAFRAYGRALVPLPEALEPLRAIDMFLRSAPHVLLSGALTLRGTPVLVREAHGMVASYHGRALPPRWTGSRWRGRASGSPSSRGGVAAGASTA